MTTRPAIYLLLLPLSVAADTAPSAWLALCDGARDGGRQYLRPDGGHQTLLVADAPMPSCESRRVAARPAEILWHGLIPESIAARSGAGLSLLGVGAANEFQVSEVIPTAAAPTARRQETYAKDGRTVTPAGKIGWSARDRATWIWDHRRWTNDAATLIHKLEDANMTTVYITVPLSGDPLRVTNPEALALFTARASAAGIEVWVVEGDPAAVTVEGRLDFVARAGALADYNAAQGSGAQLHGVQYDIEPYLLPGFDLAREDWLAAYLKTLRQLRGSLLLPMEVAVPFWWSDLVVADRPILDAMTASVDGVTVMNYRTDPAQLYANAVAYLEWGQNSDRHVRIALETGELVDQTLRSFRRNDIGRLWQVEIGNRTALMLRDKPVANPHGPAFAQTHIVNVPASRTTFFGARGELEELLPKLSRQLTGWPAYAGIALHEYIAD